VKFGGRFVDLLPVPRASMLQSWTTPPNGQRYDPGMTVVVVILALVLFYWIIRKAVRDGMRDAWKRRSRETGGTMDDSRG
jgi:hypothetical protein